MKEKTKKINLINKPKDDTVKGPREQTNHRPCHFLKRRKTQINNVTNEKGDTTANLVLRV